MEKKKRAPTKPRPRNAGTMTEAAFWSFIRSAFRKRSLAWKPFVMAKRLARRAYTGTNKRQKFEYQCSECKHYFREDEIHVDHITPIGSLKSALDLPNFVEGLFCEVDKLQILCLTCHACKTKADNANTKKKNEEKGS